MKTLKLLSLILILVLTISVSKSNATEIPNPNNLRIQIYNELVTLFEKPIPLFYEDKNLKGESFITIVVADNGRLFIADINGKNNILNNYIRTLVNTRNLWTDPDLAGTLYKFKIISR